MCMSIVAVSGWILGFDIKLNLILAFGLAGQIY